MSEQSKNDITAMMRRCDAELEKMSEAGMVPAPYYFERVAILSRKEQNYEQELFYCEQYISKVDEFYSQNGAEDVADVRKGPRYKAIVKRLAKARALYAKQKS